LVGRWLILLTIGNWVEGKFVGLPDKLSIACNLIFVCKCSAPQAQVPNSLKINPCRRNDLLKKSLFGRGPKLTAVHGAHLGLNGFQFIYQ